MSGTDRQRAIRSKRYNRNEQRIGAAVTGAALICYVLAYPFSTSDPIYRILIAIAAPAIFAAQGMERRPGSWSEWMSEMISDISKYVISAVFGMMLDVMIRFWTEVSVKNIEAVRKYLSVYGYTLLYSVKEEIGGISEPANVFWIFITLFWVRLAGRTIRLLFRRQELLSIMIMLLLSMMGLWLGNNYHILYFSLDIAFTALFFYAFGLLLVILTSRGGILERYKGGKWIISAAAGVLVLYCSIRVTNLVDLGKRFYDGGVLGLLTSAAMIWLLFRLICHLRKGSYIRQWLVLLGMHYIAFLFVHRYTHLISLSWRTEYAVSNGVSKFFWSLGILLIGILLISLRSDNGRIRHEHDLMDATEQRLGWIVYVCLSVSVIYSFVGSTYLLFLPFYRYLTAAHFVCQAIAVFMAALAMRDDRPVICILKVTALFLVLYYSVIRADVQPVIMTIYVLAMSHRSSRRILRIYALCAIMLMLVCYYASMNGYIYYRVREEYKHSFGVGYQTDWASHALFIVLSVSVLLVPYKKRMLPLLMALATGLFINRYIGARADMALIFLVVPGIVFKALWDLLHGRFKYTIEKINVVQVPVYIYCLTGSIVFSYLLNSDLTKHVLELVGKITDNTTLNNRFTQGWMALTVYPVRLFGNLIYEQSYSVNDSIPVGGYFFIDSSYFRFVIKNGLIITALFIAAMTVMQYRYYRKRELFALFVLTVTALSGIMEHHLLDLGNNIFPVLLFALDDLYPDENGFEEGEPYLEGDLYEDSDPGGGIRDPYFGREFIEAEADGGDWR